MDKIKEGIGANVGSPNGKVSGLGTILPSYPLIHKSLSIVHF